MNNPSLASRWEILGREIGATGDPEPICQQLLAAYSEPHRAYHNLVHLTKCHPFFRV